MSADTRSDPLDPEPPIPFRRPKPPPRRPPTPPGPRRSRSGVWWIVAVVWTIVLTGAVIAFLPVHGAPGAAGPGASGAGGREPAAPPAQIGNPALGKRPGGVGRGTPLTPTGTNQLAAFAQGCFWGVEERFRRVPGVVATAVGYTGGKTPDPTYEQVSGHATGHAEAVLLEFDPAQVSYDRLLAIFWETHDPTSGDRQGPDVGPQYRSAVFTFGSEQAKAAAASRDAEQARLADRVTTQLAPAGPFWLAEEHHQQWDEKHGYRSCPLPHRPRQKS